MYASRLHDALAEDYPKLYAALGDERFSALATEYLRAHPPRSFTLREYGVELAAYLRTSASAPPWAADLAALERARVEVFDGPEAQPLAHADVVALDTQLPELVMSWVPSSVVVPLAWTVDDLWSAIEDGQPLIEPVSCARVVLVWRRDISVLHRTLDPDEGELAREIATGARFVEVCERLAETHGDDASGRAAELLLRWLEAAALGTPRDHAT
jgi:Putative DNA-binding domain